MRIREIELLLRKAGELARDNEFIIIGSQAAHAFCPSPPPEVILSQECDLYPRNRPEAALVLMEKLGPRSRFAKRNGFYADVVTPELATLPRDWKSG